jgi:hypothetical protein
VQGAGPWGGGAFVDMVLSTLLWATPEIHMTFTGVALAIRYRTHGKEMSENLQYDVQTQTQQWTGLPDRGYVRDVRTR